MKQDLRNLFLTLYSYDASLLKQFKKLGILAYRNGFYSKIVMLIK